MGEMNQKENDIQKGNEVQKVNKAQEERPSESVAQITERIRKVSKVLNVFVKIATVACFVGIGLCIAGAVYIMINGNVDLLVLNGKVVLHSPLSAEWLEGKDSWYLISFLIGLMVKLILTILLLKQADQMFADISTDRTPFEMKNVRRIRRIAVFYLIISLLSVESGANSLGNLDISVDVNGIIGAGIFWLISMVFEYGCVLQTESDETL